MGYQNGSRGVYEKCRRIGNSREPFGFDARRETAREHVARRRSPRFQDLPVTSEEIERAGETPSAEGRF
jgi:hypothetical protein